MTEKVKVIIEESTLTEIDKHAKTISRLGLCRVYDDAVEQIYQLRPLLFQFLPEDAIPKNKNLETALATFQFQSTILAKQFALRLHK